MYTLTGPETCNLWYVWTNRRKAVKFLRKMVVFEAKSAPKTCSAGQKTLCPTLCQAQKVCAKSKKCALARVLAKKNPACTLVGLVPTFVELRIFVSKSPHRVFGSVGNDFYVYFEVQHRLTRPGWFRCIAEHD